MKKHAAVVLGIGFLALASAGAAGMKQTPATQPSDTTAVGPSLPDVSTTTYAERNKAWPLLATTRDPELVLPNAHVVGAAAHPVKRERGGGPPAGKDTADTIWRRVPWVPLHAEYLQRRKSVSGPDSVLTLVDWCEKHELWDCAAFELRKVIQARYLMIYDPVYRKFNERYLPLAEKQTPPYVFPLPVTGEWQVIGDKTGFHRGKAGTNFAVDIAVTGPAAGGQSFFKTDGRAKEDYFAWGQPVIAQADGVVTMMINDQPDMPIGRAGAQNMANTIVIDYGGGVWALMGHLQKGSIPLRVGDKVKPGQVVGRVGNSGATGMPHLHFTLCDVANFSIPGVYRFERWEKGAWKQVDEELRLGMRVRNLTPPAK